MGNGQTPQDTARLVALDTLVGTRGASGERAVRLRELSSFMEQSIAYALKTRADPKSANDTLGADASMPTSGAWVSGPSVVLGKGVWSIDAVALFKTGAAGIIALRLHDGADGVMAVQASHPVDADYFTAMHVSGVITLAGVTTITLQAAPSVTTATTSMIAQTTIGGALDATRLSAVKIGA